MIDAYKSFIHKNLGDWPVHESHCCPTHGCKYGDDWCPVVLGLTDKHNENCEDCENEPVYVSERTLIINELKKNLPSIGASSCHYDGMVMAINIIEKMPQREEQ